MRCTMKERKHSNSECKGHPVGKVPASLQVTVATVVDVDFFVLREPLLGSDMVSLPFHVVVPTGCCMRLKASCPCRTAQMTVLQF